MIRPHASCISIRVILHGHAPASPASLVAALDRGRHSCRRQAALLGHGVKLAKRLRSIIGLCHARLTTSASRVHGKFSSTMLCEGPDRFPSPLPVMRASTSCATLRGSRDCVRPFRHTPWIGIFPPWTVHDHNPPEGPSARCHRTQSRAPAQGRHAQVTVPGYSTKLRRQSVGDDGNTGIRSGSAPPRRRVRQDRVHRKLKCACCSVEPIGARRGRPRSAWSRTCIQFSRQCA